MTHVIDNAITSTISRTIITHGCTLMMVLSILFFGGETLHYFALALTIGICFGIYSSVLVMAPLVMWMGVSREDLVKPEKQAAAPRARRSCLSARARRGRRRHADDRSSTRCSRSTRRSRSSPAQYGPWLYALLFADHLRRDRARRVPVPARRLAPVHRRHRRRGRRRSTSTCWSSLLIVAAILGDSVNYSIGHYIGPEVFDKPDSRWFKQEHLRRTQAFYDKYGGVTIIIGRFVPIIRTFAPFLAGVAGMTLPPLPRVQRRRRRSLWIASLVYAGYLFGNIPWVKDNLTFIVIGIVVVSLIPAVITFLQERRRAEARRR